MRLRKCWILLSKTVIAYSHSKVRASLLVTNERKFINEENRQKQTSTKAKDLYYLFCFAPIFGRNPVINPIKGRKAQTWYTK